MSQQADFTLQALLDRDHVPEPDAIVLDGLTLKDVPAIEALNRKGVQVIYTTGVGKHHGKRFVKLRLDTAVKLRGRIYDGAHSDPLCLSARADAPFRWHTWVPHRHELALDRRRRLAALSPDTIQRANAILAKLREADPEFDCEAEHALQLAEVLERKARRIWNEPMNWLLVRVFGIQSYDDLRWVV